MSDDEFTPPPRLMRHLELAAERRAAGINWVVIATLVKRKLGTVQSWPRRYPEVWRHLLDEARKQHAEDAGNEALSTLRNHLRHKDDKLCQDAAKKLIDHCPPAKPAESVNDADNYIESLDEQGIKETQLAIAAAAKQP